MSDTANTYLDVKDLTVYYGKALALGPHLAAGE